MTPRPTVVGATHEAATASHRPIFIVSTGRCGSRMLARVLALQPGLAAFHEPLPHLNTEAFLRWSGRRDDGWIRERVDRQRGRLIAQVCANGLTYVESSHYLSHLIPCLASAYEARFVHLHRDGRDVTRSGLDHHWYKPRSREPIRTLVRRTTALPVGNTFRDHRLKPPVRYRTRFERIAWLWREINAVILRDLEAVPEEAVHRLPVEGFGPVALDGLLRFAGCEPREAPLADMLAVARRRPGGTETRTVPPPSEWSRDREDRFWEIAGDVMERLGYAREGDAAPERRGGTLLASGTHGGGGRADG